MEDPHPLVDLDPVRTMDTLHNNRVHPQGFKTVMEAVGVADTTKAGIRRVDTISNAEVVKETNAETEINNVEVNTITGKYFGKKADRQQ